MTAFSGRLVDHLNRYVQLRRSLGHAFNTQASNCARLAISSSSDRTRSD
jgi:hypothetical protein